LLRHTPKVKTINGIAVTNAAHHQRTTGRIPRPTTLWITPEITQSSLMPINLDGLAPTKEMMV
ncbi:MAG: hypothetical protein WCL71_00855, partial [Deltaproteobacteria bacterium]